MIYTFKCNCGRTKRINASMNEIKNKKVICDCGKQMHQEWGSSIVIPDYMKADSNEDISWINEKMKQTRPTGTDRIYY